MGLRRIDNTPTDSFGRETSNRNNVITHSTYCFQFIYSLEIRNQTSIQSGEKLYPNNR